MSYPDDDNGEKRDRYASALALRTARDLEQFRRDVYEHWEKTDKQLVTSLDVLRRDSRNTARWIVGILMGVSIAILAGVFSKLNTLDDVQRDVAVINGTQSAIKEHAAWQDRGIELLNSRLRDIEMSRAKKESSTP